MAVRMPKQSEASRQKAGVDLLRSLGYVVLVSGLTRSKVKCAKCGNEDWASGWQGNSRGLPDNMVTHALWPENTWMMMEWKAPGGPIRPEQLQLVNDSMSIIVTSDIEALDAVHDFEWHLQGLTAPNPKLVRMRKQLNG